MGVMGTAVTVKEASLVGSADASPVVWPVWPDELHMGWSMVQGWRLIA